MIKKDSFLRHTRADEVRLKVLKDKTTLFSVFSSQEMGIILDYLKPYVKGIIFLIILTLGLSFLEGFRALSIVAFIRSLFIDSLNSLNNIKIFGRYEITNFINFKDKTALIVYIFIIFVALSITALLVKRLVFILTRRYQLHLMRDLRRDLYNKIVAFNVDFFNEAKSGELLFMINAEVSRFSNLILHSKGLLSGSFTILIFFAILFYMSPSITLLIMLSGILFLVFHQRIERQLKISSWKANSYQNILQQLFYEIIYGIKLIKFGGLEDRERNEYIDHHHKFETETMKMVKLKADSDAYREGFFIFILTLFSLSFFYLVNRNILPRDGSFILAYMVILLRTIPYFSEFQRSILNIVESYGPLAKIVNILTKPVEDERRLLDKKCGIIDSIQNIKIKDLSFSYKDKEEILKSIDTIFSKGKIYAIVGFSGGGKSTLLDLMVGIRTPKRGGILFNDLQIEEIEAKILKDRIGYVNQEPLIFHDTIKENVIFFDKDVTQQRIDKALEMASVKDFVYSLSQGLNTGLGERGLTISGGERQRIGLARVFLKDPEVLLLDEATNSLDYKTEKIIYDNLRNIKRDKIIVIAAHRLSSLVNFDEIIVLHNGMVEEKGLHKELMDNKGIYYSLYKLQEIEEKKNV